MLDAQQTLAWHKTFSAVDGMRVRAAIHVGTADERDGDYFGPTVNRVARLLAIGHGGQVLGIRRGRGSSGRDCCPSVRRCMIWARTGSRIWRNPNRCTNCSTPDLRTQFPPLRSLDALPNNLPRMPTSFIGRETEIAEITASASRRINSSRWWVREV